MFERFTPEARTLVTTAMEEAAELGHLAVGAEHLVAAALRTEDLGIDRDAWRSAMRTRFGRSTAVAIDDADADALEALGISLPYRTNFVAGMVVAPARRWGPFGLPIRRGPSKHISWTADARSSITRALREALDTRSSRIRVEHLVLGTLGGKGVPEVLTSIGGDPGALQDELRARLRAS